MEAGPDAILSDRSDWDLWLFNIRIRATGLGVWDLIDPSKDTKPRGVIEPKRPESLCLDRASLKDSSDCQRDLVDLNIYRLDLEEYQKQQQNLATIALRIASTVAPKLLSSLVCLVEDHHPWAMMRTLASRMAPTLFERVVDADIRRRGLEARSIEATDKLCVPEKAEMSDLLDLFDKKEVAMALARKITSALDDQQVGVALVWSSPADEAWFKHIISKTTESKRQNPRIDVDELRRHLRNLESLYNYLPSDRPDDPDWQNLYFGLLRNLIDDAKTI